MRQSSEIEDRIRYQHRLRLAAFHFITDIGDAKTPSNQATTNPSLLDASVRYRVL
jgi:hypothetical protein